MLKALGAVIFLISLTVVGIRKAAASNAVLETLSDAVRLAKIIKSEISEKRAPMDVIAKKLEREFDGYVSMFGKSLREAMQSLGAVPFSAIWAQSVSKAFSKLPDDSLRELCSLGAYIGKYSADIQLEALNGVAILLEDRLNECRPKCAQDRKMYIGLYSGIGLIVTVMLI